MEDLETKTKDGETDQIVRVVEYLKTSVVLKMDNGIVHSTVDCCSNTATMQEHQRM